MKAFDVFVSFSAWDGISGKCLAISKSMGLLNQQSEALQKRLNGFASTMKVGAGITAFGVAAAAGLWKAVEAAGSLNAAIAQLGTVTKLSGNEFDKIRKLAQNVTAPTGFTDIQGVEIMGAMAHGGLLKSQWMNQHAVQQFTNFAELRSMGSHHEDATQSVLAATRMTNAFGISTQNLPAAIDRLNADLIQSGESTTEFQTTFKYIANQAKLMHMKFGDVADTVPWLSRMGFGQGRGGTNFATFLERSVYGTGKKHDANMRQAGLVVNGHSALLDAQGTFVGLPKAVQILQDLSKRFGGNANRLSPLLHNIFGTQGARVAGAMMTGGALDQWTNLRKGADATPSVNATQGLLLKQLPQQLKMLGSNLRNIVQNFGLALLPDVMKLLNKLNEVVANVKDFTQNNPAIMRMAAGFAAIATATSLIVGPTLVFVGALGYLGTSGILLKGLGMIGPMLGGVITIIGGVGLAVAVLYTAWTRNWGGMRTYTQGVFKDFKSYYLNDTNYAGSEFLKRGKLFIKTTDNMEIYWKAWAVAFKHSWIGIQKNLDTSFNWISLHWKTTIAEMTTDWNAFANMDAGTIFDLSQNKMFQKLVGAGPSNAPVFGRAMDGYGTGAAGAARRAGHNALGTNFWGGGPTWVGERGPELVNLPRGSSVTPSSQAGGGDVHVHFHAGAIVQQPYQSQRELVDIIDRELGIKLRNRSYASPNAVVPAW